MSLAALLEIGADAADSKTVTVRAGEEVVIGLFTEGAPFDSHHTAYFFQVTPGAPSASLDETGEPLALTKARHMRTIKGPRTVFVRRPAGFAVGVFAET